MSQFTIFIKFNFVDDSKHLVAHSNKECKEAQLKRFEEKECWCFVGPEPDESNPSKCWLCGHKLFTQLCDCDMCTLYREHRLERDCDCYRCKSIVRLDNALKH